MCDPEYKSMPGSYSRAEKFKARYNCNGCERESSSQIKGVFVNCVGIATFHVGACCNVCKALIGSV